MHWPICCVANSVNIMLIRNMPRPCAVWSPFSKYGQIHNAHSLHCMSMQTLHLENLQRKKMFWTVMLYLRNYRCSDCDWWHCSSTVASLCIAAEAYRSFIQSKDWIGAVMVRDQCSLDRSSTSDQTHQYTHLTNVIIPGGNQPWAVGNQGFNLIKDQTAHGDMECVRPLVLQARGPIPEILRALWKKMKRWLLLC